MSDPRTRLEQAAALTELRTQLVNAAIVIADAEELPAMVAAIDNVRVLARRYVDLMTVVPTSLRPHQASEAVVS